MLFIKLTSLLLVFGLILNPSILFSQESTSEVDQPTSQEAILSSETEEEKIELLNPEEIIDSSENKAEENKNLKELLADPFSQIKDDSDVEVDDKVEDFPEPTEPQQSLVEHNLEEKIDVLLKEMIPQEYVGITASVKYFIETVPVTKNNKKISKIKLPGFENHVWVPTKSKDIIGIVNQTRTYTTIFIVVRKPVSPFNIEVLRQSLSEKIEEIDLLKDDVLKVVYVPHASATGTVYGEADQLALLEKTEPLTEAVQGKKELLEEVINEIPKKKKKPEKLKEDIDMLMKMETTRYLLKARNAYERDDYDTAINAISEAIDVNPFSPQAFEMLGSIYYRLGWNNMALENWQRALRLAPSNELLRKYIARVERL